MKMKHNLSRVFMLILSLTGCSAYAQTRTTLENPCDTSGNTSFLLKKEIGTLNAHYVASDQSRSIQFQDVYFCIRKDKSSYIVSTEILVSRGMNRGVIQLPGQEIIESKQTSDSESYLINESGRGSQPLKSKLIFTVSNGGNTLKVFQENPHMNGGKKTLERVMKKVSLNFKLDLSQKTDGMLRCNPPLPEDTNSCAYYICRKRWPPAGCE